MAEKNNSNKILTILLAIIICISAVVVLYVSLPKDDTTDDSQESTDDNGAKDEDVDDDSEEPVTLLTIIYNNTQKEYTLEELKNFSAVTGTGRYVKSKTLPDMVIITPDLDESAWDFTGVSISTLLDEFENLPDNYNITVASSDDWTSEYTKDQVDGIIDIYNESGIITSTSGATLILAYKESGEYITDEEVGPLRIALVGDDIITLSSLWSKMVVLIEVVEV